MLFPGKSGLVSFHSAFFLHLFWKRTSGDKWNRLFNRPINLPMSQLSVKALKETHPFYITSSFMPAFKCQYVSKCQKRHMVPAKMQWRSTVRKATVGIAENDDNPHQLNSHSSTKPAAPWFHNQSTKAITDCSSYLPEMRLNTAVKLLRLSAKRTFDASALSCITRWLFISCDVFRN